MTRGPKTHSGFGVIRHGTGQTHRAAVGAGVVVHPGDRVRPTSYEDRSEWDLRAFCRSCSSAPTDLSSLDGWWAGEEYKRPTWDLLAECTIGRRRGYLLVEAKAHESELHSGGKPAATDASPQSQ